MKNGKNIGNIVNWMGFNRAADKDGRMFPLAGFLS